MDDTADRRHTSVNKPSRFFHTWGAIWNYLNWCYLNVINVIKACLLLHSICTNMHFPLSPTDAGMNIWISYGGLEGNRADWWANSSVFCFPICWLTVLDAVFSWSAIPLLSWSWFLSLSCGFYSLADYRKVVNLFSQPLICLPITSKEPLWLH